MFHGGWLVGGGGKPRSQGNIGVVLGTSSYHHQPVRGGGESWEVNRELYTETRTGQWYRADGGGIYIYIVFSLHR